MQLDLLPFGEQALRHFLYLERPEGMERQDAEGFVPTAPPREPLAADETMPRGQEYATVGHLYRGIGDGLRTLVDRLGERAVFVGSPRAQATPELFRWPELVAVTDLGVGAGRGRGDHRAGRGRARRLAARALRPVPRRSGRSTTNCEQRDPSFEPARPVLAAFTRQPFDIPAPHAGHHRSAAPCT